jgi:hypothetical protein
MVSLTVRVLFLTLAICSAAVSADASTPKIWGYGTKSCTSYVQAYQAWEQGKQDQVWEYFRYRDWLTGFVSALTMATGMDILRGVQPKNAMRRINLYCEENLSEDYFSAASEFIRILGTGSSADDGMVTKPK